MNDDARAGAPIAPRHKLLIAVWLGFLIVFYGGVGTLGVLKAEEEKAHTLAEHASIMDPTRAELGHTQANGVKGPTADTVRVYSGMYIERIAELSPKQSNWTVDFYIWFRWQARPDMPDLDPGNSFQVIDGAFVIKPVLIEQTVDGSQHYELYRAKARITKFFNMARFPRDDHLLTVRVEDKRLRYRRLKFEPDVAASAISSRVEIPGYKIVRGQLLEKPHAYRTSRGDPRLKADQQSIHSQLVYAILIKRPGWGLYLKLFQGMFAAVCIGLLAFLLSPTDKPRFPLGIGAFFASVASTYITSNQLPGAELLTLTDVVNGVGMVTIFFTLLSSIISLHLHMVRDDGAVSRLFDRACLVVFAVGVVAVNLAVVSNAAL